MSYSPHNPDALLNDDGTFINEPVPVFPILLLELEAGDRGFEQGYRYQVDHLDEHQHFFRDWSRVAHFVIREGLDVIEIDEMKKMRDAGHTY